MLYRYLWSLFYSSKWR